MNKPIQVGDLVMLIKRCHPSTPLGVVYKVAELRERDTFKCNLCRGLHHGGIWAVADHFFGNITNQYNAAPTYWLKRIPPLSELEEQDNKQEQPA